MPVSYEIDACAGLVTVLLTGVLDSLELLTTNAELSARSDIAPDFDFLVDCCGITGLRDLSTSTLQRLASRVPGGARRAIVIPQSSSYLYGMARMFQLRRTACSSSDVVICETVDEARGFLRRGSSEVSSGMDEV